MNNTILYTNPYRQGMKEVIEYNEPKIISQKSFLTLNIQQQKHKLQATVFLYFSLLLWVFCALSRISLRLYITLCFKYNNFVGTQKSIQIIKAFNNHILCFFGECFLFCNHWHWKDLRMAWKSMNFLSTKNCLK